ncbi:MAG: aldolase/citrate lyase family protein [Patescibacteria group bacterium]|nr:aldolase/citrate lyase family protein [Patescibacteria group bacterium]
MTLSMRPSRVLAKLRAGEVVNCFKLNLSDARAVEIAALTGFDCLWLDMEHVPNDWSAIERGIWAAKSQDTDVMVRVARGSYSDHVRPLEMDAAGIMVPHIMSLADAQAVVRMTRFHPIGRRPVDGGNADGAYCAIDFNLYLREANEQRFVAIQIEDPEPLAELDAIAALPGIDMLFFGPGDFSQGIGAPGEWDHPRLIEAREQVAAAALAHGKVAGTVGSPATLDTLISLGYRFLSMGADVVGLSQYCRSVLGEFRNHRLPKDATPAPEPQTVYGATK